MFKSFRQFRYKSIFVSIFASMLAVSMLVSLFFALFAAKKISGTVQENSRNREAAVLDEKVQTIDYILREDIHQSMVQMAYSGDVLSIAISKEKDAVRINDAITDAAFSVKYNLLIDRIAVYYPLQDCVLVSDYTDTSLEDAPDRAVIEYHQENQDSCVHIRDNEKTTDLFWYQGNYIMAFDYPLHGEERLATIYYYLNIENLFESIETGSDDQHLYVADKEGHLILENEPDQETEEAAAALKDQEKITDRYISQERTVYYEQSELTGWAFYYSVKETGVDYQLIIRMLLPFVLILMAGCLAAAYLLTSHVYEPVRKLMLTLHEQTDSEPGDSQAENEIDVIGRTIDKMRLRNNHLHDYMQNVSSDVTGRMFFDIINGNYMMASDAERLLNSLPSPFEVYRTYCVWQIAIVSEGTLSYEKHTGCKNYLNEEFERMQKKTEVYAQVITIRQGIFAVILMYPKEQSDFAVKKMIAVEERQLLEAAKKRGFVLDITCGDIYHSLLDIGFSYKEAKAVSENKTDRDSKNPSDNPSVILEEETEETCGEEIAADKEKPEKPAYIPDERMLRKRADQIISIARAEKKTEALELLQRVLDEECMKLCTRNEVFLLYESCMKVFMETIAGLQNFNYSETMETTLTWKKEDFAALETREVLLDLLHRLSRVVEECEHLAHKKNNKHLTVALQYIDEHYQDQDLSLNVLSQVTGMNASYLSRFFHNNLNVGFSTYVNNLRLEKAAEKLAATNAPVNKIAEECGFSTIQNFMRQFKKAYGKTPREYRIERMKDE